MEKHNGHKCTQWFITYPKSGDETKEGLIEKLPICVYSIVCKEAHQDGSPHLHAGIKLKHGLSKSNLRRWIENKWPDACQRIDYKPIRSFTHARDYCKKEDPEYIETGELKNMKKLRGASERNALDEAEARAYCMSNTMKEEIMNYTT